MSSPSRLSAAPASTFLGMRSFFGQPIGLAPLFLTELWERFSFYGMRAILTLYLVAAPIATDAAGPGLGIAIGSAAAIYGSYNALVYLTPLAGGWIADRMLGARRTVLIGGVLIALGHYQMAIPAQVAFWTGLLTIALGTGLLKPNISEMVGDLYHGQSDARRDAGFSLFYMGINLGAFLSPLVVGFVAMAYGWHWGFLVAGIGMTIALGCYLVGWRVLGSAGQRPARPAGARDVRKVIWWVPIGGAATAAVFVLQGLITGYSIDDVASLFAVVVVAIAVVYFVVLFRSPGLTRVEISRLRAFLGLFIGAAAFWMIYDQAGSTLNVFADEWTDLDIGTWTMPTAWLQSVNPIFIIVFAPIFAWMWTKLANRAPSTPMKFAIAVIGIGLSFWLMVIPGLAADNGETSAVWWLIAVYLMQTWAELLLSPTGLSAATQLAPVGRVSQVLAVWFLATAVGDALGGQVVRVLQGQLFWVYFAITGGAAVILGVVFVFLAQPIARLMRATS